MEHACNEAAEAMAREGTFVIIPSLICYNTLPAMAENLRFCIIIS
jgi:hypothetical protein